MKNQKGISLIALIITIIVIIILAAIVIGGVFNTPNDAKFANFCQEYDRIQTAVQLKYYELYQKYAIMPNLTRVPTHYDIYKQVAQGGADYDTNASSYTAIDKDGWVDLTNFGTASTNICEAPKGLYDTTKGNKWFLRLSDGKIAYSGFEKSEADMYYTPNVHAVDSSSTHNRAKVELDTTKTAPNQPLKLDKTATIDPTGAFTAKTGALGLDD